MSVLGGEWLAGWIQVWALFLGIGVVIFWLVRRVRGEDPLPEGPAPVAKFTMVDVVVILFLWLGVQITVLGVTVDLGFSSAVDRILEFAKPFPFRGPVDQILWVKLAETSVAILAAEIWIARNPRHGPRGRGALTGLMACLAFFPVAWAVLYATEVLYRAAGWSFTPQAILEQLEAAAQWKFVVLAVVLAPITEEILFRGVLYVGLKRRTGPWIAAAISSGVWTFVHRSPAQAPALFVLGLALAYVYERTGTLVAPLVLHGCFNGFTVLQQILAKGG